METDSTDNYDQVESTIKPDEPLPEHVDEKSETEPVDKPNKEADLLGQKTLTRGRERAQSQTPRCQYHQATWKSDTYLKRYHQWELI